ncbi:MAG: DUF6101 family protein [Hyphomicrobiales bacterium]
MRRQATLSGLEPAWTGRSLRLDPTDLPARFRIPLPGPDARAVRLTDVEIDRVSTVMYREVAGGIPVRVSVPLSDYRGVSIRFRVPETGTEPEIVLELLHADPALTVPLAIASDMDDIIADWRIWGRELSLPLITVDEAGTTTVVSGRFGRLTSARPVPRRFYSLIADRRPRFLVRRKVGSRQLGPVCTGHEMIARR